MDLSPKSFLSGKIKFMSYPLLKALVDINSYSLNPSGLNDTRALLEEFFDPLDAKKNIFGNTLVYQKRPKAPIKIFLGGHYDTVHNPKSSFQKLTQEKKGLWKGPGVADMKGGLIILLLALLKFEKTPHAKRIGWNLVLNGDEEIGSRESSPLIKTYSKGCKGAFLFEPSLPDGSLVSSRKGSINLIIKAFGVASHAGRDLASGKNAIIPLSNLMHTLKDHSNINFGSLQGGSSFNVVPDYAELKINFRSDLQKDFTHFLSTLKKELKKEKSVRLEVEQVSYRPPKPLDAKTKELIKALNYPVQTVHSGGVCDGNLTAYYGIPTLDTLGAVGGNLHTDEEYIDGKSIEERAELFFQFLINLSRGNLC